MHIYAFFMQNSNLCFAIASRQEWTAIVSLYTIFT